MDPRHESFKQGLLNHAIATINAYIQDHGDDLVADEAAQEKIRVICRLAYQYLGVVVDVNGIISRQNLLSIDVVKLPLIEDPEAQSLLDTLEFVQLIEKMNHILQHPNPGSKVEPMLFAAILDVLNDYVLPS